MKLSGWNLFEMRAIRRQEVAVLLFVLSCTCVYGMKIDFTRLRQLRKPFLLEKRIRPANVCPPDSPFLCKSSKVTCIALTKVCNNVRDCEEDGFDENPQLCNAKDRPSIDEIEQFLIHNDKWILPEIFDGADPRLVAHGLAVASDLDDLKTIVGMSPQAEENLHEAFMSAMDGDERSLLDMGMPDSEWFNVQYMLNRFREGGLAV